MLDSTKYPNNVRTVSGTPQLYKDDVVLLCDTSGGPVVLNLLEIPDQWSTLWKLYIIDVSGNAMTNNITINAGGSQIVNGNPSLVIDVDNGSAIVRVSQTGKFNAGLSYTTVAPGTGHVISDEGTPLTQQPILNFVGPGVTATNGAGETIITIPGGGAPVELTNAQLLALILAETVVKGTFYCITDPTNAESVVVQGCTTTTVTNYGSGLFLNADYQAVGDYSGVPGFGSQLGTWNSELPDPSIGDVCIWDNNHYVNTGGSWGASALDGDQWTVLAKSSTTGFIYECNFVLYDIVNNRVASRRDNRGNYVEYAFVKGALSLEVFPWGNDKVTFNEVSKVSIANITNSNCTIKGNTFTSGSTISEESPSGSAVFTPGSIIANYLSEGSEINIISNQGTVQRNNLTGNSTINVDNIEDGGAQVIYNNLSANASIECITMGFIDEFSYNHLTNDARIFVTTLLGRSGVKYCHIYDQGEFVAVTMSTTLEACSIGNLRVEIPTFNTTTRNKRVESGFSNFEINLDLGDPAVYPGGNLIVLDPLWLYVGLFEVVNSAFLGVAKIQNSPLTHPFTLRPTNGNGINLSITAVAGAVADDLIGDEQTNAGTKQLTGRTFGADQCTIEVLGNLNAIIEKNVWA